ncbi:hypothetical protein ACPCXF_07890 [Lysinibacillus agricola]
MFLSKASGVCLRFWIVQAQFKIWTQLRQGEIDIRNKESMVI